MQRGLRKYIVQGLGKLRLAGLVRLLIVLAVIPVSLAQTQKQPWAFTLEERIALRTDSRLATDRVRGAGRIRVNTHSGSSTIVDSFEGRSNPELFLPHELFRMLVRQAYLGPDGNPVRFRLAKSPMVQAYGLPPGFWDRLEVLSALYILDSQSLDAMGPVLRRARPRERNDVMAEVTRRQIVACSSRAAALAAARQEFGEERFDRFLYEVIAPHMFHVADELPRVDDLRYAERGCR